MDLPRLAYIGEVPPRAISAGPSLLFRLFETFPRDRLLICEDASHPGDPARQLPGVEHVRYPLGQRRFLNSRFGQWYSSWLFLRSDSVANRLLVALEQFRCEAIVGIAHGHGWWPAWLAAARLNVPFHLLVHDDWRISLPLLRTVGPWAEQRFGVVYRGACSRLVISPAMREHYRREYEADATVLYPMHGYNTPVSTEPPIPSPPGSAGATVAYAGGLGSRWSKLALIRLAHAVAPIGASVRIHQNLGLHELRSLGLRTRNVEIIPFQSAEKLHRDLIAHAQMLFLPMSFAPEDRRNVEVCFPSKLVDYTATALPAIFNAPGYSSVARWLRDNPAVGPLIDDQDPARLESVCRQLVASPSLRRERGCAAFRAGNRDFSHGINFAKFANALVEVCRARAISSTERSSPPVLSV